VFALAAGAARHGGQGSPALSDSPRPRSDSSLTIALAGDIMLGRGVKRRIDKQGQGYPFELIAPLTATPDIAIGNLESPLTSEKYKSASPWKFKGDTLDAALELKKAGFDLITLANNHALDCGRAGLLETARWLDSAGIAYSGITNCDTILFDSLKAADSLKAREYLKSLVCKPAFVKHLGLKIGFLGFCEPYLLAIAKDHGAELVARADSATVVNSIVAIRDSCDLIICSFHWGGEYCDCPTKTQKKLGRIAIDAGARIVHGHHPHVLQGVEFYQEGIIAYSLGNFIFDQRREKTRQSALLTIRLRRSDCSSSTFAEPALNEVNGLGINHVLSETNVSVEIDSVFVRPLEIVNNRPQPAGKKGWKAIAARLKKQCARLNTSVEFRDSLLVLKLMAKEMKKPR
ncbi:MAG: CapA family protein, partial [Candidatus Edwardsbacteria bacterium]|nr:CapA family protein [Candidatus Edwardsbacteria bacterium]